MYNHQLDTFIRVADAGSFNKAAEEAYITPTAVIKQINLLETSLDVKLFERTHRGLVLTKAGRSLYQDTKYIIQYCRDSVIRAKNAMQEDNNIIDSDFQRMLVVCCRIAERLADIVKRKILAAMCCCKDKAGMPIACKRFIELLQSRLDTLP